MSAWPNPAYSIQSQNTSRQGQITGQANPPLFARIWRSRFTQRSEANVSGTARTVRYFGRLGTGASVLNGQKRQIMPDFTGKQGFAALPFHGPPDKLQLANRQAL